MGDRKQRRGQITEQVPGINQFELSVQALAGYLNGTRLGLGFVVCKDIGKTGTSFSLGFNKASLDDVRDVLTTAVGSVMNILGNLEFTI